MISRSGNPGVQAAFLAAILASTGVEAASFTALGGLPASPIIISRGYGVSADGGVVVGWANSIGTEAFRWTGAGGLVGLGELPNFNGGISSTARAVSANGAIVVGVSDTYFGDQAFRWTQAGGMVSLGSLGGATSGGSDAFGVSADGSVIVGVSLSLTGNQAFRWTAASGMVGLGDLSGGTSSSNASAVSADGTVVVGTGHSLNVYGNDRREAFRWTSGGLVGLGTYVPGLGESMANGVSADGLVVVGEATTDTGWEAFRWTAAGGMEGLGDILYGGGNNRARAASGDGSVIVGSANISGDTPAAFVWTAAGGMQTLFDVLVARGASVPVGWKLEDATSISADGRWVTGWARNTSGGFEAWVADLAPVPVPAAWYLMGSGLSTLLVLRRKAAGRQ